MHNKFFTFGTLLTALNIIKVNQSTLPCFPVLLQNLVSSWYISSSILEKSPFFSAVSNPFVVLHRNWNSVQSNLSSVLSDIKSDFTQFLQLTFLIGLPLSYNQYLALFLTSLYITMVVLLEILLTKNLPLFQVTF